jgi:membrane protein DedA with SNARE-associated domain
MKLNSKLAGNIIYVITFAILVYLIVQGFFMPNQYGKIIETVNLSLAIIAFVLLGVAYFLRLKSKKSEGKKNAF